MLESFFSNCNKANLNSGIIILEPYYYQFFILNLNKILPTQKSEMEMMERIWGLAFNQIGIEFKENVVLKNKSGSSGPLQEVILKNKKNNKELAVPVKMATRDIDDSIIKYWSGRL